MMRAQWIQGVWAPYLYFTTSFFKGQRDPGTPHRQTSQTLRVMQEGTPREPLDQNSVAPVYLYFKQIALRNSPFSYILILCKVRLKSSEVFWQFVHDLEAVSSKVKSETHNITSCYQLVTNRTWAKQQISLACFAVCSYWMASLVEYFSQNKEKPNH